MTHPLEELAKQLTTLAHSIRYERADGLACEDSAETKMQYGLLLNAAVLVRRSIPDCECGELVRRELAMDGPYRSISFTRRDAGTGAERVLIYGTDAKRIPFIEETTKTLDAAVAATKKGTP